MAEQLTSDIEIETGVDQVSDSVELADTPPVVDTDREHNLLMRENRLLAIDELKARKVPESLLDFVMDEDPNRIKTKTEALAKVWSDTLRQSVKNKVAADPATSVGRALPSKPFAELSYKERLDLKRTSPDLYKQVANSSI